MNKKESKVWTLSIMFFIFTSTLALVQAYNTNGYYWRAADSDPVVYYDTSGYSQVSTSVSEWNSGCSDQSLSSGTSSAKFHIYKVDYDDVGWDGHYYLTYTGSLINTARAEINDHYLSSGYDSNDKKGVIGHEIGHCLGLAHWDNDAIMNSATFGAFSRDYYSAYSPQTDDCNGVDSLY